MKILYSHPEFYDDYIAYDGKHSPSPTFGSRVHQDVVSNVSQLVFEHTGDRGEGIRGIIDMELEGS